MLPILKRILSHAGLVALLWAVSALPAPAQNDVRGAVAVSPPQAVSGNVGAAAKGSAAGAQSNATAAKTGEAQPKFPNKDTAKNRRDYDMGTDTGGIQLGRDEATGDTVMRHNPPKKPQEPYPFEKMPIEVRPLIVR